MKVKKVLEIYLKDLQVQRYSTQTIRNYRIILEAFTSHLEGEGIEEIEDITATSIRGYIASKGQNKASYVNGIIKRIKVFFKWCVNEEYISRDPSAKVRMLREEKVILTIFNDMEMKQLLEHYNGSDYLSVRNRTILYILCEVGLRALEICKLKVDSLKGDYILVHGKGNKERIVPISNILRKQLGRYFKVREKFARGEEWLFLSRRHKQLTTQSIEVVVKEAGKFCTIREDIRCSPHDFRHYYAISSLKRGIGLFELSKLLGHESVTITQKYLRFLSDEDLLELGGKASNLGHLDMRLRP